MALLVFISASQTTSFSFIMLRFILICVTLHCSNLVAATMYPRPNIVLILTDDLDVSIGGMVRTLDGKNSFIALLWSVMHLFICCCWWSCVMGWGVHVLPSVIFFLQIPLTKTKKLIGEAGIMFTNTVSVVCVWSIQNNAVVMKTNVFNKGVECLYLGKQ